MTRRRPCIPRKVPALLFGEGASEQGYGRWLNQLARQHDIPVFIRAEKLDGGDAMDLVNEALDEYTGIRKTLDEYKVVALILDADLRRKNPERDALAVKTAKKEKLQLIWQEPCHEAYLLRHFPGRGQHRSSTNRDALCRLRKVWPGYEKGMDANKYGEALTLDHLVRAREVEPGLDSFLNKIGWN